MWGIQPGIGKCVNMVPERFHSKPIDIEEFDAEKAWWHREQPKKIGQVARRDSCCITRILGCQGVTPNRRRRSIAARGLTRRCEGKDMRNILFFASPRLRVTSSSNQLFGAGLPTPPKRLDGR